MSRLIELKNISKNYRMGGATVHAVRDLSLTVEEGEFVAIMGPSGSGKSTLLNILGFLDVASSGSYVIQGRDATGLGEDELSLLRNDIAGFVFQQFQLLPRLTAADNVLLPTIYAGKKNMRQAAADKLGRVGLAHRVEHFPSELSGGEQQRVAIARAIINEPSIIFADEPTGNLDTKSEEEIMAILRTLNDEGKTIIMVTHEQEIAHYAKRIIRMRDGVIVSDEKRRAKKISLRRKDETPRVNGVLHKAAVSFGRAEFADYLSQAFGSIVSHKLRSTLSMLGILIGVSAVISMTALGEGAKDSISKRLESMGTNVLTVRPEHHRSGAVALQAGKVSRLSIQDAQALSHLSQVRRVSPTTAGRGQSVYGSKNWNTQVTGVGVEYAQMKASVPIRGRFFNEAELRSREMVAVIGATVVKNLFADEDPVGKTIKINRKNFLVIGILPVKGASPFRDEDDVAVIPVTTALYRVFGSIYVDQIDVEVNDQSMVDAAIDDMKTLLRKRAGIKSDKEDTFEIRDMAEMRKTMQSTTQTMSLLLGAVAAISLVVGGVGVMNIMLVSVRERTREIGLRKAIGARRKDILVQFLVEAVMMTFCGGCIGIALGVSVSLLITAIASWAVKISLSTVFGAALFSVAIGVGFGLWPAVLASRLNPIEALRYE
jgi:macrolide transport system ATP-binding/permease protein